MGVIKAGIDAVRFNLQDQWKDFNLEELPKTNKKYISLI